MNVSPGDNLSKFISQQGDNTVYYLSPGVYQIPIVIRNRKSIALVGTPGAIVTVPKDNGVTLDSCEEISFQGIDFVLCGENGIYAESCDSLDFDRCRFIKNQHSGLLTAYCDHVICTNIEAYGTVEQHGIYLSSSGDDYSLDGCNCHDNERFGIQINSVDRRKPRISKKVSVTNCESHNNGQGDLQLAGVRQAVIHGNKFHDSPKCMTLWDDDEGKKFAARNNIITGNEFRNSPIGVQIRNNSSGNEVRGNRFIGIRTPLDNKRIDTQFDGNLTS